MSDIFLSYARPDRRWAESLASVIKAHGWSVWWDAHIEAGESWDEGIEAALKEAKCVVVLWSGHSAESHWVKTEAESARERKVLVPALLDNTEIPLGFARIQTANLRGWPGAGPHAGLDELLSGIARVLKVPNPVVAAAHQRHANWRSGLASLAVITPLLVAAGLQVTLVTLTEIELQARVSGLTFTSSRSQEFSDLLLLSMLEIAGFEEIRLPRARDRREQVIPQDSVSRVSLQLATVGLAGSGTITLEPLVLLKGTRATIQTGTRPLEYHLAFDTASPTTLAASLQGELKVRLAGALPETLDFGHPKPLLIQSGASSTDLDLVLASPIRNVLPTPLQISMLSLTRIDERDVVNRTIVQHASTVLSGTLTVVSLHGRPRVLESGERLEMNHANGEIERFQMDNGQFDFDFHGQVDHVRACVRGVCSDLTPTWGQWLWVQHRIMALVAASAYLLLLLWLGLRFRVAGRR